MISFVQDSKSREIAQRFVGLLLHNLQVTFHVQYELTHLSTMLLYHNDFFFASRLIENGRDDLGEGGMDRLVAPLLVVCDGKTSGCCGQGAGHVRHSEGWRLYDGSGHCGGINGGENSSAIHVGGSDGSSTASNVDSGIGTTGCGSTGRC